MQSNTNNPKVTNDPITINDLLVMMMSSGWKVNTDKAFYKTLSKGEREIVLSQVKSDWTLVCLDIDPDGEKLVLPLISKINPFPLMAILAAYGIVSLLELARTNDIDIHDVLAVEAEVV